MKNMSLASELKGEAIRHPQPSTETVPFMVQQNASWRC
jgi:hypothetical protein